MLRDLLLLLICLTCAQAQDARDPRAPTPRAQGAIDEDWPTFYGPRQDFSSRETGLRTAWGADGPRLLWRWPKGEGYASPVVAGERLILFHRVGGFEEAVCLDRTSGAFRWRFRQPTTYRDRYGYNGGPRASPVIAGEHVYVYGAQRKLACLELASGKAVWTRDLGKGQRQEYFGNATSPLVVGKRLIINLGKPCVVALDRLTGERLWACDDAWGVSYATPLLATIRGQPRVLVFAGGEGDPPPGGLLAIDPETGKVDGRFAWRSKSPISVNAATPVVIGDAVFLSASYQTGGALVAFDPQRKPRLRWKASRFGSHWTTPLYRDGHLYGIDGRHLKSAALVGYELATGKELWRSKLRWPQGDAKLGIYRGALLAVGERVLALGETGALAWLELSPTGCKLIASAELFRASETWSPPALSRGLLYVMQNTPATGGQGPCLRCYDLRAPAR